MLRSRIRSLVLAAAMMIPVAGVRADDAEKLFPKDTGIVAQFNIRQILDSALVKKYLGEEIKNRLKNDAETANTLKALNLDPLKDIERITMASVGFDPNDARAVIVITGKFDAKAMEEAAATFSRTKAKEFAPEKLGDRIAYKITNEKMPNPLYFGIVSGTQLVLSSTKETVAAAFAGTGGGKMSAEMTTLVEGMNRKSSMSLVASVKGKLAGVIPGNDDEVRKLLDAAQSVSLQFDIDKGMGLMLGFGMDKAENATAMSKKLGELVAVGKFFLPNLAKDQPMLAPLVGMLDKLKESANDKSASLKLELSEDDLLKLVPKK